jgi:hypothetical protein
MLWMPVKLSNLFFNNTHQNTIIVCSSIISFSVFGFTVVLIIQTHRGRIVPNLFCSCDVLYEYIFTYFLHGSLILNPSTKLYQYGRVLVMYQWFLPLVFLIPCLDSCETKYFFFVLWVRLRFYNAVLQVIKYILIYSLLYYYILYETDDLWWAAPTLYSFMKLCRVSLPVYLLFLLTKMLET